MRLLDWGKRLKADKKGNVLILTAAAMPLLVGSAGLAVDTIQLSLMKRHLQRAVDSGALAGAYARAQSKPVNAAVSKALGFNDAFPLVANPVITEPTSGTFAGRAVRVQISARRSLPFLAFFTGEAPIITVAATAALVYTGKYCMVSLDESEGTGITFSGSSTVNLGCGVISNTTGANAVSAAGNATVTASPVAAVGAVPSSSAYVQPTLLLPYSLKQPDPFAHLTNPTADELAGCKAPVPVNGTLAAGCHTSLDVKGTLTLAPGTHYIAGGAFKVNANANLIGNGVTIVFTKTPSQTTYPTITVDGSADLDLIAPTSGPYEGVLMHYDSRAPTTTSGHFINGNSYSKLEGAFYFPSQYLTFNGNSEMETNCIQLVAKRLTFTGNTEINNECPSDGGAKAFDAEWVRLVS